MSIVLQGSTSGSITLQEPAVAGTNTLMLPAQTGTLAINSTFAFKNRLIDSGFIVNQRGYTSGTSLASGSFGHDRWKGGASGGTYTFTQGSTGVPIVITITAGAIQQVIEGSNMPEGGSYTLSWTGTATASINGGTAASSPITVTSVTAGANMTIQFNTGTVSFPQLEVGLQPTSFDYRSYWQELSLCQRYYCLSNRINFFNVTPGQAQTFIWCNYPFPVNMRATPTIIFERPNTAVTGSLDTWAGTALAVSSASADTKGISYAILTTSTSVSELIFGKFYASSEL